MYSTTNCGQTFCSRSHLGRPTFQSGCFLTHAFSTAVLILDFDNIHRFCIVASILRLKQIFRLCTYCSNCDRLCKYLFEIYGVSYVKKDWVSNMFYFAVYLYIYKYLICDTLIYY